MAPRAVDAKEPLHPEQALSRPWAAPTESVVYFHGGWRTTGGYTRGPPLVGTPCGQAAAGREAREAAMGRSYRKRGPFPRRVAHPPIL